MYAFVDASLTLLCHPDSLPACTVRFWVSTTVRSQVVGTGDMSQINFFHCLVNSGHSQRRGEQARR